MNKNKGGVTVSAMLAIVALFLFHPNTYTNGIGFAGGKWSVNGDGHI